MSRSYQSLEPPRVMSHALSFLPIVNPGDVGGYPQGDGMWPRGRGTSSWKPSLLHSWLAAPEPPCVSLGSSRPGGWLGSGEGPWAPRGLTWPLAQARPSALHPRTGLGVVECAVMSLLRSAPLQPSRPQFPHVFGRVLRTVPETKTV